MSAPPLFVVSSERSGSTLLRYLLDTHPAIGSPGELNLGGLCAHLCLVLTRTQVPYDLESKVIPNEVRRIVSGVMDAYLRRLGKTVWCDKSPGNIPFLEVLATVFPEGRFICLYRNCRDAAYSCYGSLPHGVMPEHGPYIARHPDNYPLAMIENWIDKNEAILSFEHQHQWRCTRIRYEDLVSAPQAEMSRLMQFLGLEWDPTILERAFQVVHSPGGGDSRARRQTSIHTRSIGLGQQMPLTGLPPSVFARANDLLAALNYQPLRRHDSPPSIEVA